MEKLLREIKLICDKWEATPDMKNTYRAYMEIVEKLDKIKPETIEAHLKQMKAILQVEIQELDKEFTRHQL